MLDLAAFNGRSACVELLIKAGAKYSMFYAVENGMTDAVATFIAEGGDVNVQFERYDSVLYVLYTHASHIDTPTHTHTHTQLPFLLSASSYIAGV